MNCSKVNVTFYVYDLDQTDPEAYPATCTMGTGFIHVLKHPENDVHHPPLSRDGVKNE
jgi:hypothetical protein